MSVKRGTSAEPAPTAEQLTETRATLVRLMEQSRDAWNRADLAGHVAMYTDSATMMTAQGPRGGRDVIRGLLERGFWAGSRRRSSTSRNCRSDRRGGTMR